MSTKPYALQLSRLFAVHGPTSEPETFRLLLEKIERGEADLSLLKNAAALMHAQDAVRQVRQNIYAMRRELRGQLEKLGIKEWRVGVR